jgi:hypothetical protein
LEDGGKLEIHFGEKICGPSHGEVAMEENILFSWQRLLFSSAVFGRMKRPGSREACQPYYRKSQLSWRGLGVVES